MVSAPEVVEKEGQTVLMIVYGIPISADSLEFTVSSEIDLDSLSDRPVTQTKRASIGDTYTITFETSRIIDIHLYQDCNVYICGEEHMIRLRDAVVSDYEKIEFNKYKYHAESRLRWEAIKL
jgi:hypothetical protein